jgi:hypothetical protein
LSGSALSTVTVVKKVSNRSDRFVHGFCFGKRHRPLPSECPDTDLRPGRKGSYQVATMDVFTRFRHRVFLVLGAVAHSARLGAAVRRDKTNDPADGSGSDRMMQVLGGLLRSLSLIPSSSFGVINSSAAVARDSKSIAIASSLVLEASRSAVPAIPRKRAASSRRNLGVIINSFRARKTQFHREVRLAVTLGSFRDVRALCVEHKPLHGLGSVRPSTVAPMPTGRRACCR